MAMSVQGRDAFHRQSSVAIVQVPRSLPRLIALPRKPGLGQHAFVMLSSVIRGHADELFPGMSVTDCFQFRVTRNSDLWVDEESTTRCALQGELRTASSARPYAPGDRHLQPGWRGSCSRTSAWRARTPPRRRPGQPESPRDDPPPSTAPT
jgi:hypothetical protein